MGWHDNFGYGYGGSGVGMVLIMMLFWLPLIGLGIWLVARVTRSQPNAAAPSAQHHAADSARGILDRRFAKGEISAEQYTEMRRVLESGGDK